MSTVHQVGQKKGAWCEGGFIVCLGPTLTLTLTVCSEAPLTQRSISNVLWVVCASTLYSAAPLWATTAAAPAASAAPLRIGIVLPLTGPMSDVGNSALIGAKIAVQEINSVGGYMGRPLELVVQDDESNPETGARAVEKSIRDAGVIATLGACNTAVAIRVGEVAQAKKHPFIVTCATGSTITSRYPTVQSFIFRTSASSQIQAQFLVNDIVRSKLHKVALLLDSSPYGDAGLVDVQAAMAKAGLKPKVVMRFDLGVKNLDKEMRELKASGADALVAWTVGTEQGVIASSRAAVGWQVPQYGAWDASNLSAYIASNGRIEGALMAQTVLPNRNLERNSAFLTSYSKFSRERPMGSMMSSAQTYDGVQLLMRAIFSAKGDIAGPSLKASLENLGGVYRGVVTTYDRPFSPKDHEALSMNMLWMGTWRSGDRTYLYEEDEKRAAVIRVKR